MARMDTDGEKKRGTSMVSPIYNVVNFISRFISLSEIVLCDDLS